MIDITLRYSVCTATEPPHELHQTNDLDVALRLADTHEGSVVYDWKTGEQVPR